jgi:aspartate/methionine/tyrosine aminotransferase
MNGEEFAERCLNEAGVALIPGNAFGKFAIDNVRINFTISEENISNALENIKKMLG